MVKFPEAQTRLYKNVFICKKCKSKQRASMQKVLSGKLICKKCGSKSFRTVRKSTK